MRELRDAGLRLHVGRGSVVGVALGAGQLMEADLEGLCSLTPKERSFMESPWMQHAIGFADHRIIAERSRLQVDLGRPCEFEERELELYGCPWTRHQRERVLVQYRSAYETMLEVLQPIVREHRFVLVFEVSFAWGDRGSVQLGISTDARTRWQSVFDRIEQDLSELQSSSVLGSIVPSISTHEAHFASWVHAQFPWNALCLSVELEHGIENQEQGGRLARALNGFLKSLSAGVAPVLSKGPSSFSWDASPEWGRIGVAMDERVGGACLNPRHRSALGLVTCVEKAS